MLERIEKHIGLMKELVTIQMGAKALFKADFVGQAEMMLKSNQLITDQLMVSAIFLSEEGLKQIRADEISEEEHIVIGEKLKELKIINTFVRFLLGDSNAMSSIPEGTERDSTEDVEGGDS